MRGPRWTWPMLRPPPRGNMILRSGIWVPDSLADDAPVPGPQETDDTPAPRFQEADNAPVPGSQEGVSMSSASEVPLDAWIGAAPEDEAVAARLADALGRKGLNIARRPRHTTVGEIAAGLARSRRLLVCVSDSYLEQPAGRFELDFARHVLPGGDKAMVFAVVGDCRSEE